MAIVVDAARPAVAAQHCASDVDFVGTAREIDMVQFFGTEQSSVETHVGRAYDAPADNTGDAAVPIVTFGDATFWHPSTPRTERF